MLVYHVKNEYLKTDVVWDNCQGAIDEIKAFFEYDHEDVTEPNTITLVIEEMSEEEFNALPEFEGY